MRRESPTSYRRRSQTAPNGGRAQLAQHGRASRTSWLVGLSLAKTTLNRLPIAVVPVGHHEQHARKLRDRAEECRRLSELARDDTVRRSYLKLADAYEVLASQEEALAK